MGIHNNIKCLCYKQIRIFENDALSLQYNLLFLN